MNAAIVHARNLSSQQTSQTAPTWMLGKAKAFNPSGVAPSNQSARPHYNIKPTASISPLRPKHAHPEQSLKPAPSYIQQH
jgi:hypothetical protein